jgi:hypothetical protein
VKRTHRIEGVTFRLGDTIVVRRADETLPEEYLGRKGKILKFMPYQEVGDDPEADPFILVKHPASKDRKACTQFYWSEEIVIP